LNIYAEGELEPKATHKKFLSVRQEGMRQVKRNLNKGLWRIFLNLKSYQQKTVNLKELKKSILEGAFKGELTK